MNLIENHALIFQRRLYSAMVLYMSLGIAGLVWGVMKMQSLDREASLLEVQIQQQPFIIKKEDTQTMEDVKNHLTHLFSIPLPGISFSVLSLDEEGMRVRGNARTTESLETWLVHVSEAFAVDTHSSQQKRGKGLEFEVLLHEKP